MSTLQTFEIFKYATVILTKGIKYTMGTQLTCNRKKNFFLLVNWVFRDTSLRNVKKKTSCGRENSVSFNRKKIALSSRCSYYSSALTEKFTHLHIKSTDGMAMSVVGNKTRPRALFRHTYTSKSRIEPWEQP